MTIDEYRELSRAYDRGDIGITRLNHPMKMRSCERHVFNVDPPDDELRCEPSYRTHSG
jgi:hypothetical protein